MHHLENVTISADRNLIDFRFPVQYVVRPDQDYRGYAGRVASGAVRPGEEIMVLPSKKRSVVSGIDTFDGEKDEAKAGESVVLAVFEERPARGAVVEPRDELLERDVEVDARSDVSFMFGPAMGSGPIENREAFARQRMATLPYEDLVIDTVEALTVDGLEGLIVLAEAKEPAGPQVFVFGVFLFEATNYWIGVGTAPVEQRASVLPLFRRIAASLERE